jgi:hypothetical protein
MTRVIFTKRAISSKKAEEIMLIWWIIALGIFAVGIVLGVLFFYSSNLNINEIEANILVERVHYCISQGDILTEDFLKDNFNLHGCYIDFEDAERMNIGKEVAYYVEVNVSKEEKPVRYYEHGNKNLKEDWQNANSIGASSGNLNQKARYYPTCVEKKYNSIKTSSKNPNTDSIDYVPVNVKILACSNQKSQRA